MLIELWERLRGYDKWVQTEAQATIKSSILAETQVANFRGLFSYEPDHVAWESTNTIVWADSTGVQHSSEFRAPEGSPLFQLFDGQNITIRYNPANPNQYYLRGALSLRWVTAVKWSIVPVLFGAYMLLLLLVRIFVCGHRQ